MNVPKKVTDFIVLEEGNIGRKAATVTGAALAASVLSTVLAQTVLAWDLATRQFTTIVGTQRDRD